VISAVSVNPGLTECDHSTILSAALLGESLKLSPSPQLGQYYLVPFNDKKRNCKVAQFQLGYKGYIQLAIRSGYYKKLNVLSIKEGELVKYDPLDESIEVNLIQNDTEREAAKTIGYYAMFEYTNGFKKAMYWSREKMMAHADKYSMAFSASKYQDLLDGKIPQSDMWKYSSFWYKDFDGMAYKTMLRQLISKWGIMSIELQTAIDKDMGTIHEDGSVDYVDNSADYAQAEPAPVAVDHSTSEVLDTPDEEDPTVGFFS
jgi:recombination protein RecT